MPNTNGLLPCVIAISLCLTIFLGLALDRRCIRLSPIGQALATEAIAKCIRRGGLSEAESNIDLLDLVSAPAAADWDASFAVKCINR